MIEGGGSVARCSRGVGMMARFTASLLTCVVIATSSAVVKVAPAAAAVAIGDPRGSAIGVGQALRLPYTECVETVSLYAAAGAINALGLPRGPGAGMSFRLENSFCGASGRLSDIFMEFGDAPDLPGIYDGARLKGVICTDIGDGYYTVSGPRIVGSAPVGCFESLDRCFLVRPSPCPTVTGLARFTVVINHGLLNVRPAMGTITISPT
jgi:hypothetical protein